MTSANESVSFDRIADRYDATRALPPEQQTQIARGILTVVRGGMDTRIVEPGVGTGRLALPLLREGVTYTGTDISPRMLDEFRLKLRAEPWLAARATVLESDACDLPFQSGSFDMAFTAHLLHLVADWRRALDEIKRVVRPGGYYVNGIDNLGQIHGKFASAWRTFAAERGLGAQPQISIPDNVILGHYGLSPHMMTRITLARWLRPRSIRDMLQKYGRRDVSWLWSLSDPDHEALMRRLEAWAIETYGDLDGVVTIEASYQISVLQFPT